MKFRYKWWGKGDLDASFGVFFDGFSKILSATGILIFVFGMPVEIVIGRIVPAIGFATFLGNMWYFYEARELAKKEKRSNVTAQPFGVGASQVSSWLFLIIGPVYWQTGDAMLAFYVGLTAAFIGGIVEIIGAIIGKWLIKVLPTSALLGNLASGAFIWLSVMGIVTVFNKPEIAIIPLFIILIDYIAKCKKRLTKIPSGIIAIAVGSIIAWSTGMMSVETLTSSFDNLGFYMPKLFTKEIFSGFSAVLPYLPIIIPLQIANFLTTLQGVESAKMAGDDYPARKSMLMDGVSTVVGALLGNPFPTTVYYGHPCWKEIDARAGYSLVVGITYLLVCTTGLTGVIMAIVPYEVVIILLVYVGLSVSTSTFQNIDKKYYSVLLLSTVPIIIQYVQMLIDSVAQAAGSTLAEITAEKFAEFSVPITGITILSSGAFLSSLLLAAVLALVIDRKFVNASVYCFVLAGSSFIGLIHNNVIELFPRNGTILGLGYLAVGIMLFLKKYHKQSCEPYEIG